MKNAEVARRLHQSRDIHAHGRNAVRHEQQIADDAQRRLLRQCLRADGCFFQRDGDAGVGHGIFLAEIRRAGRYDLLCGGQVALCEGEDGLRRVRDGVVLPSARGRHEPDRELLHQRIQHAAEQNIRIGAALVDLLPGVAADEAGDGQLHAGRRVRRHRQPDRDIGARAAGAADGKDPLVLRVDVQHPAGGELGEVEPLRALHADLLVDGEDGLERRMGDLASVQDRQRHGDGDAVVAAERRAVCRDVVALDAQRKRIFGHVDGAFRRFFRNHVEMAL